MKKAKEVEIRANESLDSIYGGRLQVVQGKKGYRFSMDSLLLAAFARPKPGERVLDIGTGTGVVAMTIASFYPVKEVIGIEVQGVLAERARRSIEANDLAERVRILRGDIRNISDFPGKDKFDLALANPPFYASRDGRINPNKEKAIARHQLHANLTDFIGAAAFLLRNSGRLSMIYPAARFSELVFELRRKKLELKRVRPVYSRKGESGVLVLAEARKGGGVELEILPPLYIFRKGNSYTPEMERIASGTWFRAGGSGVEFPPKKFPEKVD